MSVINALPYGGGSSEKYKHKVEITESGTWTVPNGVTQIAVRLFGGGGGGGFYTNCGGGGGGGYMTYKEMTVTPGTAYTVTIGAGGAAEKDGGTTIFGDSLSACGGKCGEELDGGDGGTGGGGGGDGTNGSGKGGNASYGGGGGGIASTGYPYITACVNTGSYSTLTPVAQNGGGSGGQYGGNGGGTRATGIFTYDNANAEPGTDCSGGTNIGNVTFDGYLYYCGGGGGYKADGGGGRYSSYNSKKTSAGGGGGGWEGGRGGNADINASSGSYGYYISGGGGGGYGAYEIADVEHGGGYGYGAGGGDNSSGAPGICIIYY